MDDFVFMVELMSDGETIYIEGDEYIVEMQVFDLIYDLIHSHGLTEPTRLQPTDLSLIH